MTLIRNATNRGAMQALSLAGLGTAVAVMLSGCGGPSTTGSPLAPTPNSGPVIYGVNALALDSGNTTGETSGLSFTDPASGTVTGAIIGATTYTTVNGAGPIPEYQGDFPNTGTTPPSSPGLPLGFAPGGAYYNVSAPVEALPTNYAGSLIFGTYVSTGVLNNKPVDLNTTSIVLTSSEAPSFSQPLTFDPNFGNGVLAQAQYKTAAFPIPAFLQTTGLHNLHTTVSDVSGQSSTTDFSVATVAPTDVALFLQNFDTGTVDKKGNEVFNAITPGDTVTIDGGQGTGVYPTGYTPEIADAQGTVIFFITPGTHTVAETDPTGKAVQSATFTLDATTAGTTIIDVPAPNATASAAAHPAKTRVIHRSAKSKLKH